MYVKVRTMDGKKEAIIMISKLTVVEDLKVCHADDYCHAKQFCTRSPYVTFYE